VETQTTAQEVLRGDTNHGYRKWFVETQTTARKWFVETQTTAQEVVRGDTNHGSGSGSWRHEPRLQILTTAGAKCYCKSPKGSVEN